MMKIFSTFHIQKIPAAALFQYFQEKVFQEMMLALSKFHDSPSAVTSNKGINPSVAYGTEHIPSGMKHIPSGMKHIPSGTKHIPSGTEYIPSGTKHIPSGTEHHPSGIRHIPFEKRFKQLSAKISYRK